ncbi:hypothetical protein NMG60_11015005 [Bertholletia excelsa]
MAGRSGELEGINLISSTYSDDDDEMEDVEHQEPPNDDFGEHKDANNIEDDLNNKQIEDKVIDSANEDSDTPPVSNDDSTPKPAQNTRPLTPPPQQQPQLTITSPQLPSPLQPVDSSRSRAGRLTIVDYGHDEAAMSPEAEEGEIMGTGVVTIGSQLEVGTGEIPFGPAQVLTPGAQATTPQLSENLEALESHTIIIAVNESQSTVIEEEVVVSEEMTKDIDPLDRFLPSPPKSKCPDELQERINKFLKLKMQGKSYNAEVRKKKEYRNPDFLLHAVTYQDIDQIGSCFSKDVFDPHGYDKSDYYDEIEADMKREMERKEQEKKKSQKVEFVTGGTQQGVIAPAPKINIAITGVSGLAAGGLPPLPAAVDSLARDGRQNKKSKWDKVDGDSVSAAGAHTVLLTAANAGTGYTAFAQQRRKEAEDKRSSERKERRS